LGTDLIQLPPDNAFRGPPEFAGTALHELGHWTGHRIRLNREEGMKEAKFGSVAYGMEELRAELSSAFLAGELGIPTDIPQHASYISNWRGPLKKGRAGDFQGCRGRAEDC
jgi:antirestriction protein ArdC